MLFRENLLDLSYNIYLGCCHPLLYFDEVKGLLDKSTPWQQGLKMAALAFVIAVFMGMSTEALIKDASMWLAVIILLTIIFIGVIFDMVGSAVLAAKETPFHAMSAKKVGGAKHSIGLIRNADKVANFCNDIVGDITGTLSGVAGITIVLMLLKIYPEGKNIFSVLMTSSIAAVTVGGKYLSKSFGLRNWFLVMKVVGNFFYWLECHMGLSFFVTKKNGRKRVS